MPTVPGSRRRVRRRLQVELRRRRRRPDVGELNVKLLDACGFNGRYWVFASGSTNVEVTLTVTDTKTGAVRQYLNPQGRLLVTVADTSAVATCP
jgi:hypothetical protein